MNLKKISAGIFTGFTILFIPIVSVFAHPGRTASDGCHYCRTNCDKWGVPWNQRHCHGGSIILVRPTSTPLPTPTPTLEPTATPTPEPTVAPKSEVKGESVSPTNISVQGESQTKEGDAAVGLITLGALGAGSYWMIRKLQKKIKKEDLESP